MENSILMRMKITINTIDLMKLMKLMKRAVENYLNNVVAMASDFFKCSIVW